MKTDGVMKIVACIRNGFHPGSPASGTDWLTPNAISGFYFFIPLFRNSTISNLAQN
ncbi:MAG: hypothetical protein LBM08_14810 [Dysgonamonadaceae bacterium]|nr:hypothetical protein [Dysgonamonadaceae bacterium]